MRVNKINVSRPFAWANGIEILAAQHQGEQKRALRPAECAAPPDYRGILPFLKNLCLSARRCT